MKKFRTNLLIAMIAGLLAFAGVACDEGAEDPGTTEDPGATDPGLEEEPLDS